MGVIGQTRYCDFRVLDNSNNPVTNLLLSDFEINPTEVFPYPEYSNTVNVIIFERNDVPCLDALSLFNHMDGRYTLMYIPSAIGHDYVDIWVCPQQISAPFGYLNGVRNLDEDEIASPTASLVSDSVALYQDYGFAGQLLITQVLDPSDYILYVFNSSDWSIGNTDPLYALGSTPLMSNGDWTNQVFIGTPSTVHIVLIGAVNTVVAFSYFSVPNPV